MDSLRQAQEWSPERRELLDWFRTQAPSLAGPYEGALRLLEAEAFPGRIHFIAHAVRDIADRLPFVLDPNLDSSRVQYANELDNIEKDWPNIQEMAESKSEPGQDVVNLEYKLALRINSLVESHRERRRSPSNSELLFRILMRNEPSQGDVNRRVVKQMEETREYFMKWAHLRTVSVEVDEDELQSRFESFEGILHSFAGFFFTGKAGLDEILQQANR